MAIFRTDKNRLQCALSVYLHVKMKFCKFIYQLRESCDTGGMPEDGITEETYSYWIKLLNKIGDAKTSEHNLVLKSDMSSSQLHCVQVWSTHTLTLGCVVEREISLLFWINLFLFTACSTKKRDKGFLSLFPWSLEKKRKNSRYKISRCNSVDGTSWHQ